ncbi:TraA family conjugative transfer protein [Neisseria sp. Ec49-e6-T10]|uniref:TraA family conjugative transfer protein n=1 Tax=Neisseria sp. Ec49-e6-T10 TaxID=3140744 RepID=UPI003EC01208
MTFNDLTKNFTQVALNKKQKVQMMMVMALGLIALPAMAATTGAEFQQMAEMVIGWIEGWLGVMLAITCFSIGIAVGVTKQTLMPAIVGIGFALACVMGPSIIQAMFTAII